MKRGSGPLGARELIVAAAISFVVTAVAASAAAAVIEPSTVPPGGFPHYPPDMDAVDPLFECEWRKLALKYAGKLQPHRDLRSTYDALQLGTMCSEPPPGPPRPRSFRRDAGGGVYVDPNHGSDENPGTLSAPFKTIGHAVAAVRGSSSPTVTLRGGTYFLSTTLQLSAADSGLTVQAYQDEVPIINGGKLLSTTWKPFNQSQPTWVVEQNMNDVFGQDGQPGVVLAGKMNAWQDCETACQHNTTCTAWTWHDSQQGSYALDCYFRTDGVWSPTPQSGHVSGYRTMGKNVFVADLSGQGVSSITGLQLDGVRAIRARYPNGNPETTLFPNGWIHSDTTWTPPIPPKTNVSWVTDDSPLRLESFMFQEYEIGAHGACDVYEPPTSYWCSENPSGGGAFAFRIPSGLTYTADQLPNAPYEHGEGAIMAVWRPAHWASWFMEADSYDAQAKKIGWTKGGFQGARGNNVGAEWYIQNVMEELDSPLEFFYNKTTQQLYYFHNATVGTAPPASAQFVATNLEVLVNLTGSQGAPVKGVTFRGITFTAAAYTYMGPHGVPSGGDWALQRSAALFAQGTEGLTVDGCLFTRLDGNGLFLSGYTRSAAITDNEFVWIGDTAIASWGFTKQQPHNSSVYTLPDGIGIDGTEGNYPDGTVLDGNLVHEMGHYEKQSSFYFQAKSANTQIRNNIAFNGPRAGININDGFAGGNNLTANLLFNMNRETSDHGPFNSWDRQPFLTTNRDGKTPSLVPAPNTIYNNFMVANYGSDGGCIDNDDGSSWYNISYNFFVYGGHKSDFGGHSKLSYNNINAYSYVYGPRCMVLQQLPYVGQEEGYWNNTCILRDSTDAYIDIGGDCDVHNATAFAVIMGGNKVYTPGAAPQVTCGKTTLSMTDWLALGYDKGSTVHEQISGEQICALAADLLGMDSDEAA